MKKILLLDESPLFRDYLGGKLEEYGFEVVRAVNGFDGLLKLRQEEPDLIIMDFYLSRSSSAEVLEKKNSDPNHSATPVIMLSNRIDRTNLLQVTRYGVKHFFTKPIKLDSLLQAIGELLNVTVELDDTPCIIDANYNDGIIFVEVARGLNREKIDILQYKLKELVQLYKISSAKVLLILSGLEISGNDSFKLGSLFVSLVENTNAKLQNIKVLTTSSFVSEYLGAHPDLKSISVVSDLEAALDQLLGSKAEGYREDDTGVSGSFLARQSSKERMSSDSDNLVNTKFQNDLEYGNLPTLADLPSDTKIALVDDDLIIHELIKTVFSEAPIDLQSFKNGAEFIAYKEKSKLDLVILDLMMPEMDGFQVLERLQSSDFMVPIIVLSALSKRETVFKALKLGVKSYLIKPLKPDAVSNKVLEILRKNF